MMNEEGRGRRDSLGRKGKEECSDGPGKIRRNEGEY